MQRLAVLIDQQRYFDEAQTPNPNYQSVKLYQAPLSVRLGMMVGF